MSSEAPRNSYLDQVVAQQQSLEVDLQAKRAPAMNTPAPMRARRSETGEVQLAQIEGAIRAQAASRPPTPWRCASQLRLVTAGIRLSERAL